MKYNLMNLWASILLMIGPITAIAQQTYPVNLEAVLALSGANNLTVQEYRLKYHMALAEQSKANEWWLPNIYAGLTTHFLNGAAMNTDGTILTGVNRNNLWAGLGLAFEIDFSKGFYQSLAARQKSEAAKYFSSAEKNKAILKAVQTYFDMQTEQLKYFFLSQLASQADTISQQIRIKMEAGLLYQSEYLLSQSNSDHLKFSMLQAKVEWQKKSAELACLLNLANNIRLVCADTSLIPLPYDDQAADTNGFEKRQEFSGLNSELQSIQTLRKTVNAGLLLPLLRIGFDDGAFGSYNTPLYNTYQVNAALLWNLPFGRLTYNGDVKKYDVHILIQQNEIEQFKGQYHREISITSSQLQITEEAMAITKHALLSSSESLNQSIDRQALGTAKPFEVFQAQQFFLQAQLDFMKSVSDYNKTQFERKVALGIMLAD